MTLKIASAWGGFVCIYYRVIAIFTQEENACTQLLPCVLLVPSGLNLSPRARARMHITCTDRALDCNGQIDCIRAEYNCARRNDDQSINQSCMTPCRSAGGRSSYIIIIWPLRERARKELPPVVCIRPAFWHVVLLLFLRRRVSIYGQAARVISRSPSQMLKQGMHRHHHFSQHKDKLIHLSFTCHNFQFEK